MQQEATKSQVPGRQVVGRWRQKATSIYCWFDRRMRRQQCALNPFSKHCRQQCVPGVIPQAAPTWPGLLYHAMSWASPPWWIQVERFVDNRRVPRTIRVITDDIMARHWTLDSGQWVHRGCADIQVAESQNSFIFMTVFVTTKFLFLFIICPMAIAYSMGQIIKSFCVCACVCLSVCGHSHGRISSSIFTKLDTDV